MTQRRRSFNRAERLIVFRRANGVCAICNNLMGRFDTWEIDHIRPFSKGGETIIKNAQLLCFDCNRKKGNHVDNTTMA